MFDQQFRRRCMNATASSADIIPRPIVVASSAGCRRMCPPSIARAPARYALRPSPAAPEPARVHPRRFAPPTPLISAAGMSAIRSRSYGSPYGLALSATVASAPTHRSRQLNFTSQTSLTSATPRTAVAAWPGSPRSRGARHGRTGLGAMGAATVAAPVASASVVPTAPRPTMPTVSRRSPGGGPGSGGPRPAGRWVVESDRRLGPNGAPQPPAPRLVSGQPRCSATLGRPAAATPVAARTWLAADTASSGSRPGRRGRSTGAWRSAPPLYGDVRQARHATRTDAQGRLLRLEEQSRAARGPALVAEADGSFLGPPRDETLVGVDDDQDRDRDRRESGPRVRSRGGSRQRTGGGPACAASRAMSGARTPAQAAVAPLWLATDAPLRRVGPLRRGDRVALSIRHVIRA